MIKSIAIRVRGILNGMVSDDDVISPNPEATGSYSQNAEDMIIDSILCCKPYGIYVDIGANDSTILSNTKRFYDRGWMGICIEPHPSKYLLLQKERQRDIVINCGVSEAEGNFPFYHMVPDTASTFDSSHVRQMEIERGAKVVGKSIIPTLRLDTIFNTHLKGKEIDFVSIDTEGYDMQVLKSNDWERYSPTVILIETFYDLHEINSFLSERNYTLTLRNSENAIYVRTKK